MNNRRLLAVVCLVICAVGAIPQTRADTTSEWQLVLPGNARHMFTDASGNYYSIMQVGVQKSFDKGTSWTATSYNPPTRDGYNTTGGGVSDPSYGLFVSSLDNGVWRSTDSGTSWANTFSTGYGTGSRRMLSTGDTLLMTYGGGLRGVYKWNPTTSAWVFKFNPAPSVDGASADCFDFAVDDLGAIYTTANSANHYGGVFKSTDAGETWTQVLAAQFQANPAVIEWNGGRLFVIQNNGGVMESTDHGQGWLTLPMVSTGAEDMISTPDGTLYASFWGAGVKKSVDGGSTWQAMTDGLPTLNCMDLTVADGSLFVATDQGLFKIVAVPEPTTLALVLVGLGGLIVFRRRVKCPRGQP